jgi:hypothetical protein
VAILLQAAENSKWPLLAALPIPKSEIRDPKFISGGAESGAESEAESGTGSARVWPPMARSSNGENNRVDDGVQNKKRLRRYDALEGLRAHRLECKLPPPRQLEIRLQALSCVSYWL